MSKSDNSKTALRKSPKQERSKDLVDSVMDAAARILQTSGIDSLTTNKVAKLAGVSIGSLYQYFPGKDAIFSKLIERQIDANAVRYRAFVDAHRDDEAETFLDELISDVVDLFFERRAFIASLFSEVPKLKKTRDVLYRRNATIQIFIDVMRERPQDLRDPSNVEQQIYVLSHAVIGCLQTAILEDFENHPPEALKKELQTLSKNYLLK